MFCPFSCAAFFHFVSYQCVCVFCVVFKSFCMITLRTKDSWKLLRFSKTKLKLIMDKLLLVCMYICLILLFLYPRISSWCAISVVMSVLISFMSVFLVFSLIMFPKNGFLIDAPCIILALLFIICLIIFLSLSYYCIFFFIHFCDWLLFLFYFSVFSEFDQEPRGFLYYIWTRFYDSMSGTSSESQLYMMAKCSMLITGSWFHI